ncbi:hypothetical protein [Flavobacterium hibernum]|uniref:Outer membrane protein/protective antigen OMA87 n=1 Tax=Flavobacterium hibernum TaxID=37752 RepID=A0A0D0EYN7_9FLAO|nr:hypothetical protein [Flavobacterium hibernum]KIO52446.1 hypothetical protein IW18_12555 [Flavobacterium hibernum]OXA86657.1 hypothetical protein B0A73_13295 [Flavobacterium hibernum]STO18766.1 Outer membrane protein/protective antigen OMA87 [Flavobacterium hibernum]
MFVNKKIVVFLLLCFCLQNSYGQVVKKDAKEKKDSTEIYNKIRNYSKKNKFTQTVHKLFFRSNKPHKKEEILVQNDTTNYDGKIIRNINIVTLDPFGHSISDTTKVPKNWGERTGNRLHLKTKKIAIYNLLLFKRNSVYNTYKVQESERLIRSQKYVTAVRVTNKLAGFASDSVDVTIRVLDSWSTIPKFAISSNQVSVGIKEKDFFGSGQQLEYQFTNRFDDGRNANDVTYTVPNIKNTYIGTTLHYKIDLDNNYIKSINTERLFYSPLTQWAGGVYIGQNFRKDTLQAPDKSFAYQPFKNNFQDFWAGKATKVFEDESGITNLVTTARFLNVDYTESPTELYDPTHFYSDEKFILSGIGLNRRKFIKDSYIFRNGQTEDVPIGRIYGITLGYQYKNTFWRPYVGAQFSFGNYYRLGFLSMNFEAGTFFHQSKTYQTAFSMETNYFTKLYTIGRWKLRQFVNPKLIIGINHEDIIGDQLNINEQNGLAGFNSAVYGTNKMVLSLQTQTYSPYSVLGFRMNPFFNYSIAGLGTPNNPMEKNKAYSKITIGLLISNDYLVFSSFQLSLSYYPTIPFQGDNVFKTNTFETTDYGLQSFELAKPRPVEYK